MPQSSYGTLEDRAAIRERSHAYVDSIFQRDVEAWGANWTEDGVWFIGGREISGLANLKPAWLAAMKGYPFASMEASVNFIEFQSAERARSRVHTFETLVDSQNRIIRSVGEYTDDLVKQGGVWRYAKRVFKNLHAQGRE